ncbi:hypothetical protein ACFSTE_19655 [Aquimarina hainanensis]|uniref:Uncharacterized protein n=1 Tax=Aquimarina hainanensis TaxID=1578017 RepID=A0ABW5NFQ4_9FLAO|nr:hypothetical protein [Aquimarina sp. TRL1]QKX06462.1 hypothetical protein HN014_16590 [Aquimarina sp. TRL1]
MKPDKEILSDYGKKVISECYDPGIAYIDQLKMEENPPFIIADEVDFVKNLTDNQIKGLKKIIHRTQSNLLFSLFRIFEECNEEYKIFYKDDKKMVDLVEISEMLKAEHMIKGGWIDRFSKKVKDDEAI